MALLYCLRDTGGRIGGLLNARLDDLDLKAGLLTVCEKGNRMRDLPLNDPVRAALRQWLKARALLDPETDHLFIGLHGRPLTRNSLYSILERLKMAGHIRGRLESPFVSPRVCARCPAQRGQYWWGLATDGTQVTGYNTEVLQPLDRQRIAGRASSDQSGGELKSDQVEAA